MKRYLTSVLIPGSLLLILVSCGTLRQQGYSRLDEGTKYFIPVYDTGFDKSLYNVRIIFGEKVFSGLAVIKYMPVNRSYRLALLSEAGLRLFEAEFTSAGDAKVNFITDFLDKKAVVKKLSSDFALLFSDISKNGNKIFLKKDDTESYVVRVKKKGKKDYFYSPAMQGPEKIEERGFPFGRTTVLLSDYLNNAPQEIVFKHKMLKFEIGFTKINYKEWN